MKIMIDVDELEREGVLTPELAAKMRQIAMRDTGSTAINIVLAFGAIAVAAGLLALFQSGVWALCSGSDSWSAAFSSSARLPNNGASSAGSG